MAVTSSNPLGTISTPEAIANRLRERILSGRLAPGDMVTQATVVGLYGKSRPSSAEAIDILVAECFLTRAPNRPAIVTVLPDTELPAIIMARRPWELEAVATLASRGGFELPGFSVAPADWRGRIAMHAAFHRALIDALDNPHLSLPFGPLVNKTQLCLLQLGRDMSADLLELHWHKITNAIGNYDEKGAVDAMSAYLDAEAALAV